MVSNHHIAAIWARVSGKSQTELSPEGQVERVKAKLESLGYSAKYVFKVVWSSLDLEPCPEFQELRSLITSKKINAVGFLDRDRLEAVGLQRLTFLSDCRENGVEPIVYQGPAFISEPEGQLVELALAIGKERSVKRAQSGAKQGLRDRALLKGLPPTMKSVCGMKWENLKLVPDENYGNACEIWRMALQGRKIKQIGRELLDRVIPTPTGKPTWSPSSIRAILTNPVYAGRIGTLKYERVEPRHRRKETYGKTSLRLKPVEEWHWLEGFVTHPIVTWGQFLFIQERLKLNRLYASRNAKRNFLLRGLIKCQLCHSDRHYYGVERTGQEAAYVCSAAWAQTYGKKCQAKPLPCAQIETEVKANIRSFIESPGIYLPEINRRNQLIDKTIADIERAIKDLEKEKNETIYHEQRAFRLLSDEAFEQEQPLIKARRIYLTEQIEREKVKLANHQRFAVTKEQVEQMRQRLQNKPWRKRFLRLSFQCRWQAGSNGWNFRQRRLAVVL